MSLSPPMKDVGCHLTLLKDYWQVQRGMEMWGETHVIGDLWGMWGDAVTISIVVKSPFATAYQGWWQTNHTSCLTYRTHHVAQLPQPTTPMNHHPNPLPQHHLRHCHHVEQHDHDHHPMSTPLLIVTGNPGVSQSYPYPCPQKPVPAPRVRVLTGTG